MKHLLTTVEILGFHFHIEWWGQEGLDQHGNHWYDPENPVMKDSNKMDSILDAANDIIKKMGEV